MWYKLLAARGANQIASCLYKFISNLSQNVNRITLYSDSCFGQNKNSDVCAMFFTALQNFSNITTIDHKFLIPGHTHMACDVDHSIIERLKKKTAMNIYHPRDWFQLESA